MRRSRPGGAPLSPGGTETRSGTGAPNGLPTRKADRPTAARDPERPGGTEGRPPTGHRAASPADRPPRRHGTRSGRAGTEGRGIGTHALVGKGPAEGHSGVS